MSLKDWICCPRGDIALNKRVDSLFIVKDGKQSIGNWEGLLVEDNMWKFPHDSFNFLSEV